MLNRSNYTDHELRTVIHMNVTCACDMMHHRCTGATSQQILQLRPSFQTYHPCGTDVTDVNVSMLLRFTTENDSDLISTESASNLKAETDLNYLHNCRTLPSVATIIPKLRRPFWWVRHHLCLMFNQVKIYRSHQHKHHRNPNDFLPKMTASHFLTICIVLTMAIFTGFSLYMSVPGSERSTLSAPFVKASDLYIELDGTLITTPDGTQLVLQRASNSKGTVLLFHGCSHSATDFFPKSASCQPCLGLPEELHIVRKCLARGLSAIAVSSTDRQRKCWQTNRTSPDGPDYDRVESALKAAAEHGIFQRDQPLFAVGASSGGYFATSLKARYPQMIASNSIVAPSATTSQSSHSSSMHPQVFTHMAVRDMRTAHQVGQDIMKIESAKFAALSLAVQPIPITKEFLSSAFLNSGFPHWNYKLVQDVYKAIADGGLLDGIGALAEDPRRSNWRSVVKHLADRMNDSLVADKSPLSEELNRAWGAHEMTADRFDDTLDFFFAQMN